MNCLIDRWINLVFPAAILVWFGCWLVQLIPSERLHFAILWHLFNFVTKGSPRMCFVTVFVLNFPCNCTLAFVAEFELPRLCLCTCFRITLVCFRFTFASEVLPSYMFPIYFRSGIWAMRFRCLDFVPFPTPCFELWCFLGNRTIAHSNFSETKQ